jgi:hypothetical protein
MRLSLGNWGMYVCSLSFFHWSEYVTTAIFNDDKLSFDCMSSYVLLSLLLLERARSLLSPSIYLSIYQSLFSLSLTLFLSLPLSPLLSLLFFTFLTFLFLALFFFK